MKRALTLLFSVIIITGCIAPKQGQSVQTKETFTFDFTPKEGVQAGSAGMLLAFVKPYYAEDFASTGSGELFRSFQDALGNDIEELIIAKGFSLKGPYQSFDEMVFEDKKGTEMLIQIEIAPRFTSQEGSWKTNMSLLGPNYYTYSYSGKASLVGKINISGVEPLTNQKIWSKSVSIPNVEDLSIQTSKKYPRVLTAVELINDPGIYNVLGKALMRQYAGIMEKVAAHFNVDEFKTLKGQIKELKAMKGY